jgi:hypothetical protein
MPRYSLPPATLTVVVSNVPPGALEEVTAIECDELHVARHGVVQVALFGLSTWMLVQALPLRAMARLVASVKFEPISVN